MADCFQTLGRCAKIGSSSVFVGYDAGTAVTTGTGNTFLGYRGGDTVVSGSNNVAIGNSADIGSAVSGAVVVGSVSGAYPSIAASDDVVLGYSATATTDNTIMLGRYDSSKSMGPSIVEYGRGHQYFYTPSVISGGAAFTLTAEAIVGGWIEFIDITGNRTLTLPSYANMRAAMKGALNGSAGELVVHNYNSNNYSVSFFDGSGTIWRDSDSISANSSEIVYYRIVETDPYESVPRIEFCG